LDLKCRGWVREAEVELETQEWDLRRKKRWFPVFVSRCLSPSFYLPAFIVGQRLTGGCEVCIWAVTRLG